MAIGPSKVMITESPICNRATEPLVGSDSDGGSSGSPLLAVAQPKHNNPNSDSAKTQFRRTGENICENSNFISALFFLKNVANQRFCLVKVSVSPPAFLSAVGKALASASCSAGLRE